MIAVNQDQENEVEDETIHGDPIFDLVLVIKAVAANGNGH